MKIIYSPEYSGTVFIKPSNGSQVMMDTTVVNTIGLVDLLELRLGLHHETVSGQERVALYYDAMNSYMVQNPDNIFSASFNVSALGTAKAVLVWRDRLKMAKWNFKGEEISERLKVIIGIEKIFKQKNQCDLADRLDEVMIRLTKRNPDFHEMELVMPCKKDLLRPIERELVEKLVECGASQKMADVAANENNNLSAVRKMILESHDDKARITLKKNDTSLMIWKFDNENEADEYLAYSDIKADVWINADNRLMDNWLTLMGKPKTGSMMKDCSPQLIQLFVTGVELFESPLNVNTLIEWLNMPLHPINEYFRRKLASKIVKEGGYRNEACRTLIDNYKKGEDVYFDAKQMALSDEEKQKLRDKDVEDRTKQINDFLPAMESCDNVNVDALCNFVTKLGTWARMKAHNMAENPDGTLWTEQLLQVASMADAFLILLKSVKTKDVDYKIIDGWISNIYKKGTYTNDIAEKGCRTVTDSAAKLISVADKTIWVGMEGDSGYDMEYDFLSTTEKQKLKAGKYIDCRDEKTEAEYHEQMELMPLIHSRQLIIVVCKRRNGEQTQKHPLMVRLEQLEQLDENKEKQKNKENQEKLKCITKHLHIDSGKLKNIEKIVNKPAQGDLTFNHADLLMKKWPEYLSPTRISTLVEYPLDYMMENMLHIQADGKAQMADVKTIQGNVAHAVIERLFKPRDKRHTSSQEEIKKRVEQEYESVFSKVVEEKGAILLLVENKLTLELLREQLRKCLDALLKVIKDNELKVTGCEHKVKDGIYNGIIDMTLEDSAGKPVVFDFKWTSSEKYYKGLLEDNRSVQLEMYRSMLANEKKNEVEKVAYFLMPKARLYSSEKFKGSDCWQVKVANNKNIVEQLHKSIEYRKCQMIKGVVETAGPLTDMAYYNDTEKENLFPLEEDKETKKENRFSDYKLF